MAITSVTQTIIGPNMVRVTWASDDPTPLFRIWRDGLLVATTTATYMDFYLEAGENMVLDVYDDTTVPSAAFPGRMVLFWYHVAGAEKYRIEEYIAAAWVAQRTILDDGKGSFTYTTRFLEDGQYHKFRVVPVGTNGNDGLPIERRMLVVRHPSVPEVSYSYSAVNYKVTIASA
jgi:hypothetical protein